MTKLKPGNYGGDIIILSVDQKNCASPNFGQSFPQLRRFNVSALISIFLDLMMKETVWLHVMLVVRHFDRKHVSSPLWFQFNSSNLVVFCDHLYAPAMQTICGNKLPVPVYLQTHIVRSHAAANFHDYIALPLSLRWDIKLKYGTIQSK